MNTTKHDLSANKAILNLDNLIRLAEIAAGLAQTNIERALGDLQNLRAYGGGNDNQTSDMMYASRRLADAARAAEFAFENLYYLKNSLNREEKVIAVNQKNP